MDISKGNKKNINQKLSYCFLTNECNSLYPYTVGERLDYMSNNYPNKVVFIFNQNDGLKLTYEDIRKQAYLIAKNLIKLNVKKGDKIAYILPNTYELLIFYFAVALIGAISVPLDDDYGIEELEYVIKKTQPKAIVCYNSNEYKNIINNLFSEIINSSKNEFKSSKFDFLSFIIMLEHEHNKHLTSYNGAWSYKELTNELINNDDIQFPYVDPDDILTIIFTSGTTSKPKGIVHTHFSMLNNCAINSNLYGIPSDTDYKHCNTLLMYNLGVMVAIFRCLFVANRTFVFPSFRLNIKEIIETIEKYDCLLVTILPKILKNLLEHKDLDKHNLSCLKYIASGGQTTTSNLILETKKKLNNAKYFSIGFGMTEIGIISINIIDLNKFNGHLDNNLGQALSFTEVKIVDPITGQMVPFNTEGELHVRGYNVTKSYYNDDDISKLLIDKNGWLNTKDILSMDKDGFLYFKSRSKEVITVRGSGRIDVYPATIEECIQTHPRVKEAIVFGVSVNDYEQEICAWIKLNKNENDNLNITDKDIIEYCKGKLPDFKIPKFIKFVDNFPVNKIGKYMRSEMEKQYKIELNL